MVIAQPYEYLNPIPVWTEYLKDNPTAESEGATLQSALDQLKAAGHITGYVRCDNEEDAKANIEMGRFIYTGSANGDWRKVRDSQTYALRTD
jgi:hypothetical protein